MSVDSRAQFPKEQENTGEFVRQASVFRDWVKSEQGAEFPAVAGRYHLYVSLACPWAHRTVVYRKLLGLEDAIGLTVVDPIRDERGWVFREGPGHSKDPINGFEYLAEAYRASDAGFDGRVTVPVLWDKERGRIVNNESADIIRMLGEEMRDLAKQWVNLRPEPLRAEIDAWNERIYDSVNNGVYRAGFATTQEAYEQAAHSLFDMLDTLEVRLADRRYLHGDVFTETDWRLFTTLIRFDVVYVGHFKCNIRRIADYTNLSRLLSDLYHVPGVAETVDFDHIKRHYYVTHQRLNPSGIVPVGPELDLG